MADTLRDIDIIDMNRSIVDEERSEPENGLYFFKEKVSITDKSYKDAATCPDDVLKWGVMTEDGRQIRKWRLVYNFDFVVHKEDPYYPEGAELDGEGHWIFGDAILMKCPLELHMQRKQKDLKTAEDSKKAAGRQFRSAVAKDVRDAAMSEEELEPYLTPKDIKNIDRR